jgi:hypothetical protein
MNKTPRLRKVQMVNGQTKNRPTKNRIEPEITQTLSCARAGQNIRQKHAAVHVPSPVRTVAMLWQPADLSVSSEENKK